MTMNILPMNFARKVVYIGWRRNRLKDSRANGSMRFSFLNVFGTKDGLIVGCFY